MSEQNSNTTPSQFCVFKKSAAIRFVPQMPDKKYGVGCVLMTMAPLKEVRGDTNIYDWENKIIIVKLGVPDLISMLSSLRSNKEVTLFHQYKETSKSIKFSPNSQRGGFFVNVNEKKQNDPSSNSSLSIPLSEEESLALSVMVQYALPKIHNW